MGFDSSNKLKWRDAPGWLKIVWAVAMVNFASFCAISIYFGGDAVNGYESGGRFFLASHGRYTEVSGALFTYSRIHAYSVFVTHPAALLGAFWFAGKKRAVSV